MVPLQWGVGSEYWNVALRLFLKSFIEQVVCHMAGGVLESGNTDCPLLFLFTSSPITHTAQLAHPIRGCRIPTRCVAGEEELSKSSEVHTGLKWEAKAKHTIPLSG